MTLLFLNQDAEGKGVLGAGDVEIGLNRENTRRLLTLVQQAISTARTKDHAWRPVGQAEFTWSDHSAQSESGEDHGTVLIESNGSAVRMAIRTKKWDWEPYVATFGPTVLDDLSALLTRALSES